MKPPQSFQAPMNLNEFQELATRTAPEQGKNHFFSIDECSLSSDFPRFDRNIDLIHAVLGVCSEAGELADPVKKAMMYGKPLDILNIKEGAGGLLWYLALLCRALDCTMDELGVQVIDKLRKRYPSSYSDSAAVARADKEELG